MLDDIRPANGPGNKNSFKNTDSDSEEPPFVPPDVVAEQEESVVSNDSGSINVGDIFPDNSNSKQSLWQRYKSFVQKIWPESKKGRIIAGLLVAVVILGGSGITYALLQKKPSQVTNAPALQPKTADPPPKPTTEPSRLTGAVVPVELNARPVTSVQIENSPDARPQAGLREAGVVFEAIAEGGITRFNAMYQENQPGNIGPVRSIRPYYIDFFLPFDASVVHAGGSGEGLAKIKSLGVKDIDHGANAQAFRRASDRYAPHNLYTNMAALDEVSRARGFTTSTFTSYLRKAEKPGQPVTAKSIDFNISSFLYNPHYDYIPATNSYHRSLGGRPHTDQHSGAIIEPKVVVALVMGFSQNGVYSVYQTTGAGMMYVFQDGQLQKGTWKKAGPKDQFEFIDEAGQKLALNPGQTWFSIVADPGRIAFTP